MTKKIIGSIGLVAGLVVVSFFLYLYLLQDGDSRRTTPIPVEKPQVAVSPEPVTPKPPEPVPPVLEPGASPDVATVPTPTTSPPEQIPAPQPLLQPKEEHGLLAGRYRSYDSAKKIMEKIKKKDIPAFIRKEGKYYEVWAGPFSTPEKANQAKKSLKVALKISAKKKKLEIPVPK